MASKPIHQAQAEHNEKLAEELVSGDFYDWSCTASFYSALHYIEAKFYDYPDIQHTDVAHEKFAKVKKMHPSTISEDDKGVHWFRSYLLTRKFPNIREAYRSLEVASQQARYLEGGDHTACELIPRDVVKTLLKDDLQKIKKALGFS